MIGYFGRKTRNTVQLIHNSFYYHNHHTHPCFYNIRLPSMSVHFIGQQDIQHNSGPGKMPKPRIKKCSVGISRHRAPILKIKPRKHEEYIRHGVSRLKQLKKVTRSLTGRRTERVCVRHQRRGGSSLSMAGWISPLCGKNDAGKIWERGKNETEQDEACYGSVTVSWK